MSLKWLDDTNLCPGIPAVDLTRLYVAVMGTKECWIAASFVERASNLISSIEETARLYTPLSTPVMEAVVQP